MEALHVTALPSKDWADLSCQLQVARAHPLPYPYEDRVGKVRIHYQM